jgi:hypothetical protein
MSTNKKTLIDGDFQVGSSHFYVDTENNYVGFNKINPTSSLDVNGNAFIATDMTVASNVTVGSNVIAQKFTGSAEGLTSVPADQISGVIPVANGGTGTSASTGTGNLVKSDNPTFTGTVTADTFSGSGASLTNIPMSQATGVLAVANGGTGVTTTTGTGNVVYSDSPTLTGTVSAVGADFSSNISASNVYAGYDTDTTSFLGRAAVGFSGITDEATFAHIDVNSTNNYALKQTALGETHVNSATSKSVKFLINDTEQARINTTGLGIGTDDPQFALDVHGNANVDVLTCKFISGDGWQLSNVAGYSWPTHANGNDIYYTTGNVGIGTDEPNAILEVAGADSTTILRSAADAATTSYTELIRGYRPGTTSGGATLFINGSTATMEGGASTFTVRNDSGNLRLGHSSYETQVPSNFEVGEANLYVNTTNSRIGVGTAAPDANLHVMGNTYVSSNFEVGQDKFFVDTTATRVGIGTSSPGYTLDVVGDINMSSGSKLKVGGVDAIFSNWTKTGNDIYYTAGNVGIGGPVSATNKLKVHGTVEATSFEGTATNATNVNLTENSTNASYRIPFSAGSTGNQALHTDGGMTYNPSTNTLSVDNLNLVNSGFANVNGDAAKDFYCDRLYYDDWLRCNGTGAQGLYWHHTSNPGYAWYIYPESRQDMTFRTGSGNGGIRGKTSDNNTRGYVHWTTANEIGFLNSGRSWSLRMDNAGTCFITKELYVNAGWVRTYGTRGWYNQSYGGGWYMTDTSWVRAYNNKGVYAAGAFYTDGNRSVIRGGSPTLYFRDTNQLSGMIHVNGERMYFLRGGVDTETWSQVGGRWPLELVLSNNDAVFGARVWALTFTSYSDIRHKTNILRIDDALNKVDKLNGYTYTRTDNGDKHIGVVAQEVLEVIPEVVAEDKNGYYSVDYGQLGALFIEAIKELKMRITELEKKIN